MREIEVYKRKTQSRLKAGQILREKENEFKKQNGNYSR